MFAGSLYGLATAFVSADAFPFQLSIVLLVGAVVGGIGSIIGALFGGLITEFLPIYSQQLLLPINKQLANAAPGAVQGVLLLIVLGVARGGIAGLLHDLYRIEEGSDATTVKSAGQSVRTALMLFMSLAETSVPHRLYVYQQALRVRPRANNECAGTGNHRAPRRGPVRRTSMAPATSASPGTPSWSAAPTR